MNREEFYAARRYFRQLQGAVRHSYEVNYVDRVPTKFIPNPASDALWHYAYEITSDAVKDCTPHFAYRRNLIREWANNKNEPDRARHMRWVMKSNSKGMMHPWE